MGTGFLKVELFASDHAMPVGNVQVLIKSQDGTILHKLMADENGITERVALDAPEIINSEELIGTDPEFSVYDVVIPGTEDFRTVNVIGVQIFAGLTSILPIHISPIDLGNPSVGNTDNINIPHEHGVDMPKDQEGNQFYKAFDIEDVDRESLSAIPTLDPVPANDIKIPEYITVHLGHPSVSARNVRLPFKDYIKNVASSEIFPNWEDAALRANIYCQISLTLNRVFTSWYRSRGFNFDITNSTRVDQMFVDGRNIFENISRIVDDIFNVFIRREGRAEPFYAEYCNGTTSTCPGLSQWGSQHLALQGFTPIQILRHFYPNDVKLVESTNFVSNVEAYPGSPLREGASGEAVRTMQIYLNRISGDFFIPNTGRPDGIFGPETTASVIAFQRINNLTPDGVIGRQTWYQITRIYTAVKRLAELVSEGERTHIGTTPPNVTISLNARGENVVKLQFLLNMISEYYNEVPYVIESGVFSANTRIGVMEFQRNFGLSPDGVVGPATWRKLYEAYHSIIESGMLPPESSIPRTPPFPGVPVFWGERGLNVSTIQTHLNAIARYYPSIPSVTADGYFGPTTHAAVVAFQRKFGLNADGIVGAMTWNRIMEIFRSLPAGEGGGGGTPQDQYPGTALRVGSRGESVRHMQNYLRAIAEVFPVIPMISADGSFGPMTENAVKAFQRFFGLTSDGVVGPMTWNKIVEVYHNLPDVAGLSYPGTALRVGSRGNSVTIIQRYLSAISAQYPNIAALNDDGNFGPATERSVIAFQRQFGLTDDGVVGPATWAWIVSAYNKTLM